MIFAADLIKFETLIPLAVFGTFAALAWWALELVAGGKSRAVERLDQLKKPRSQRREPDEMLLKKTDTVTKMLEKATPALAKPLQPKDEMTMGKLKTKLANAGFRGDGAGSVFLGLKFVGLVAGLLMGGSVILAINGMKQNSLISTVAVAGLCFYLPDLGIGLIGRSRKQAIFLALPDALDLMVVCVEAGLGLDQAMRKVSEEMQKTYRVLAEEFALSNFQLQMGRPRGEVLHELGVRTGVSDLRSLSGVLIQADKFGSSIAQALRVQSDSMRTRRRQMAEEKAAKTAVKLIFPLVLFIFPGIFVILVGPAAITMAREMFPAMQGR
ncbi:MAG: type II secretion system F family protein [Planctomycetota bacterium]